MALPSFFKRQDRKAVPAPPADLTGDDGPVQAARTRARRRLIGAVVLLAVGVVGFPLLFETKPRPLPANIPIDVTRREGPLVAAPSTAGVPRPSPAVTELPPDPAEPAAPAARVAAAPLAAASPPGATAAAAPVPTVSPPSPAVPPASAIVKTDARPAASPSAASKPATDNKATEARKLAEERKAADDKKVADEKKLADARKQAEAKADAERARQALEGRGAPAPATSAADGKASDAKAGRYVVQVGAFTDANALREVRARVEKLGLKTYTQSVDTDSGKRTRVRVGPFATKQEAESASSKLKGAGLPGNVLVL